jgi:glycosyltransferase involved in cell wall biosynthesis
MSDTHLYRRRDNVMPQSAPHSGTEPARADPPRRVAMLAPPWIPIPPPGYGGIESMLALLCDALVARGHDVELFCAPGSRSRAKVTPLLPAAHPESIERALFEADHVGRALDRIEGADQPFELIHDHTSATALASANRIATPLVHTVHGPFDADTTPFYDAHGAKGRLVCISQAQARMAPSGADVATVVYNPLDVDAWPVGYHKEDWLLWLGRFVPEKGPQRAIQVAKESGRKLVLAGTVQPRYERWFATEIAPHIDGTKIRFVGEVGGARKQRLFADAYAFLMPIRWPEPFGMVMVEALASGTPVLAFPEGAAPEIVEHGVNGFLVADEHEMAAMVDRAGEISPEACRTSAVRFSPDRVAQGYEAAYAATLARAGAPAG